MQPATYTTALCDGRIIPHPTASARRNDETLSGALLQTASQRIDLIVRPLPWVGIDLHSWGSAMACTAGNAPRGKFFSLSREFFERVRLHNLANNRRIAPKVFRHCGRDL